VTKPNETALELPIPTLAALVAHRDLTHDLAQWAPTVHSLVRERVAALAAASGPFDHPTETRVEFAERVLAQGQYPFPAGVSVYDNLNSNITYEHVEVGYGLAGDGEARITFTGTYPVFGDDRSDMDRRTASISCPGWLVSEPNGVDRFAAQTADMVDALELERAGDDAKIADLVRGIRHGQ
jgi:hypothetical protein